MRTRILPTIPPGKKKSIETAARLIRDGKLVAFPTETVYGLGANALDKVAVRKIFKAKGRPPDNPLIVHLFSLNQVAFLTVSVPQLFWKLADAFMPGPLTIVLRRSILVPDVVTAGLSTVGIRLPDHPVARALLEEAGVPIVAPSANLSGKPSPTRPEHVIEDLSGKIDAILAGGKCRVGLESTVLDITRRVPVILRPGAVTREEIEKVLKRKIRVARPTRKQPASPGMKYKHYAPDAELIVFEGKRSDVASAMAAAARSLNSRGMKVGVMVEDAFVRRFPDCKTHALGVHFQRAARRLFEGFRSLDAGNVDVILCQGFDEHDLGHALMNRLRKAATRCIRV